MLRNDGLRFIIGTRRDKKGEKNWNKKGRVKKKAKMNLIFETRKIQKKWIRWKVAI